MTEQDQHLIDELKQNIRRLIDSLEKTKAELEQVRDEYKGLEYQFSEYKNEHEALLKRYENLKVAKALADGDPENQAAKLKINRIIREVDKCMALLNK
ncbi:MAG: hypothetical protein PF436_09365 [Prolixibacteraceae bacterium]|jgi:chromosome segregation ATPase|nr:hypothetical protein [Prolixibacteraceae bacterium]